MLIFPISICGDILENVSGVPGVVDIGGRLFGQKGGDLVLLMWTLPMDLANRNLQRVRLLTFVSSSSIHKIDVGRLTCASPSPAVCTIKRLVRLRGEEREN